MPHKQSDRSTKREAKRAGTLPEQNVHILPIPHPKRAVEAFEPRNEKQRKYAGAMRNLGAVVFGLGPAGTGKTYVAATMACEALIAGQVERIILTRPAIEAGGEELGFLPGEKEEKFDPYFDPIRDVLNERLGKGTVEMYIKEGRIKCEPFAYMRGKTFKNAFVILDEAQNATAAKFKMFLTRIGHDAIVVINGDESQVDIKEPSGFKDAANRLMHIPCVRVIMFEKKDVVRSGFVQEVIEAYERDMPRMNPVLER